MASTSETNGEPRKPLRFGIMGSAAIAKKNARAILRCDSCTLVAIASRSLAKAEAWCAELGLATTTKTTATSPRVVRCVEGYDALVSAQDVDAVYVPLPTSLHLEWVGKLANAGKHVLVEKPVGRNTDEVRAMIEVCRAANVAFLDGTMFVHHARFAAMKRLFDDALHWHCERVTAAFTFYGGEQFLARGNIRTRADGDPLGCLGDVGWYCARLGLYAFRHETPESVSATLRDSSQSSDGVIPFEMDVEVYFAQDRLLTFHCSFKHHFRQWFEAYSRSSRSSNGGARVVTCDDFVIPRREELCEFAIEEIPATPTIEYDTILTSTKVAVPFHGVSQELEMFRTFADVLVPDPRKCDAFHDAIVLAHRIMDAAMASARDNGKRTPLPP